MRFSLSESVEAACRRWPERIALVTAAGEEVRFDGLLGTVLALAEQAQDRGVRPGELVALEVRDGALGLMLWLALLRLGATVICAGGEELEREHGLAPAWIVSEAMAEGTPPADPRRIVVTPDWIRPPSRLVPVSGEARIVRMTSGTTGRPKLRALPEEAQLRRVTHSMRWRGEPEGPAMVAYRASAMTALQLLVQCLLTGVTAVMPGRNRLEDLQRLIRHEVRELYLPPHNFNGLIEAAERSGLRTVTLARIVVGGGGVSPEQAARARLLFDCPVYNTYGSSETGSVTRTPVSGSGGERGLLGRPLPEVEYRIEAGGEDPAEGELVVRTPTSGEITDYPSGQPVGDAGGWIRTGDLVRVLEDGRLVLTGRRSELLNLGGAKRAPGWFEERAAGFPGLRDVAAFGVPDGAGNDIVGLAVVADEGFSLAEFATHMSRLLGPAFPLQIGLVEEIPASEAGKVDRAGLSEAFAEARRAAV